MQVRAYNHWVSLLGDQQFPSIEDLDPENLPDFGPYSVLLDFTSGIEDPGVPFLGKTLAQECGHDEDIHQLSDIPSRSLLSRITDHYMQILANEAPIGFEAEFVNDHGRTILYRGILLPFSSDDDSIDFIYGVINWKELADQLTTDSLMQEIEESLNPAMADLPDEQGLSDEPALSGEQVTPDVSSAPADDHDGAGSLLSDMMQGLSAPYANGPDQPAMDEDEEEDILDLGSLIRVGPNANGHILNDQIPGQGDWANSGFGLLDETTPPANGFDEDIYDGGLYDDDYHDGSPDEPSSDCTDPDGTDLHDTGPDHDAMSGLPAPVPAPIAPHTPPPALNAMLFDEGIVDEDAFAEGFGATVGMEMPGTDLAHNTEHGTGHSLAAEDMGLGDWLASARELAFAARASEDRSRRALYAAIGRAYDFALAAEQAPEDFTALLQDAGLKRQARAPMTPVVKLVFGADYDKTRLTEYAAALSHGLRLSLPQGALADFLAKADGGLKGVVADERQLRRKDKAGPTGSAPSGREKLTTRLRKAQTHPLQALPAEGEEFALVMIRRLPDGTIAMLGEVPDNDALIAQAARQLEV